tara:strand:- start:42 stop:278 length:237 start_codon:yes stop_codon:yes gene_type:complete
MLAEAAVQCIRGLLATAVLEEEAEVHQEEVELRVLAVLMAVTLVQQTVLAVLAGLTRVVVVAETGTAQMSVEQVVQAL